MSHLQYYSYPGFGETQRVKWHYNQAVRIGDRIECSGQGGWNPETSVIHADINDEVDQAFANVELALKTAGGKGWSQVFRINLYSVDMSDAAVSACARNLKKWMPDHQPLLTFIGVAALGMEGMRVEVEVQAHDEEGAKKAAVQKVAK